MSRVTLSLTPSQAANLRAILGGAVSVQAPKPGQKKGMASLPYFKRASSGAWVVVAPVSLLQDAVRFGRSVTVNKRDGSTESVSIYEVGEAHFLVNGVLCAYGWRFPRNNMRVVEPIAVMEETVTRRNRRAGNRVQERRARAELVTEPVTPPSHLSSRSQVLPNGDIRVTVRNKITGQVVKTTVISA